MTRDRQLLPKELSATDGAIMYETKFGFHRQPFQCADLGRAFFVSASIRSIVPQLLHTLRSDLGIAVLTGSTGVGKTSLLKHLQSQLAHDGRTFMCSGASLETVAEVQQILQASSQQRAGEANPDLSAIRPGRNRWSVIEQMRKTTEFWGPVLLFIDDAQLLSVPVLNELRAFTEEEWNGRSLVRCLIAAPLSFEEELARPGYADFSHRIRCHAFLQPLTSSESVEFLSRHLEVVGGQLRQAFEPAAIELIAAACDGLPRCLSLLADESLIVTSEDSHNVVTADHVQRALTRLQHLPYPWAVSPRNDSAWQTPGEIPEDPADSGRALNVSAAPVVEASQSAGVVEFGGPGVIEVGARTASSSPGMATSAVWMPVMKTPADVQGEGSEFTAEHHSSASSISEDRIHAPDYSVDQALSGISSSEISAEAVAFVTDQAFEVGHRYIPDALECIDAVDMEDGDPTSADGTAAGLEVVYYNSERSTFGAQVVSDNSALPTTVTASLNALQSLPAVDLVTPPAVEFVSDPDSELQQTEAQGADDGRFRHVVSNGLLAAEPVFDRYTWIELGRDVPSGVVSPSTTAAILRDMQQLVGEQNVVTHSVTFDKIPVRETSDIEVLSLMARHSAHDEHGIFMMSTGHSASRRFAVEGEGADNADLSTSTEVDVSAVWMDGQLIYADGGRSDRGMRMVAEPTASSDASGPSDASDEDSASDSQSVSLSFEAARAARDEQAGMAGDLSDATLLRRRFFSLPEDVKTLEWDLRSGLTGCDEVSPLADSLAALQNEVTSFQQGGRKASWAAAESGSVSDSPSLAVPPAADPQSLVSRARRRLDGHEREQMAGEVDVNSRLSDSAIPADSIRPDTGSDLRETVFETVSRAQMPSPSLVGKMNSSLGTLTERTATASETDTAVCGSSVGISAPQQLGLGQLFTRLRQVRRETGENQ